MFVAEIQWRRWRYEYGRHPGRDGIRSHKTGRKLEWSVSGERKREGEEEEQAKEKRKGQEAIQESGFLGT